MNTRSTFAVSCTRCRYSALNVKDESMAHQLDRDHAQRHLHVVEVRFETSRVAARYSGVPLDVEVRG